MKNHLKLNGFIILATLISSQLYSQTIQTPKKDLKLIELKADSKHSINFELGGRSLIVGTFAYEYSLFPRFSIGAGLGLNSVSNGDIIRNNNGTRETGRYLDIYSTHKTFGTYFFGKDKHKVFVTAGFTYFRRYQRMVYPSEKIKDRAQVLKRNLGLGYQFSRKRLYGRATVYYLELPNISRYFVSSLPWLGLSIGWRV
ncbi:MAG: hypothetical protein JXQ87_15530 [Bacteroidia bacterium]